ncbi:GNAT family N-acetyltransferase [Halobacillus campisalis]|uniref:Enhanced intracellular survival protein Eis n=1 Tax=Halobacillus campisalis TaxID=435909 RepID=A0ABW2JY76_9BACI|nr:GNAT family N-acetyltransferase [Halobacillus campisalis]
MNFKHMEDFKTYTDILSRCYPMMEIRTSEDKQEMIKHRERMEAYDMVSHTAVYEDDQMLGGYISYALPMNVYEQTLPSVGVGTLAVDLPYKKRGIAKKMMINAIGKSREEGFPLMQLYPFRPDFYRKMGFGFGPQLNVFRVSPDQVPYFNEAEAVMPLNENHLEDIKRCYHDWAEDHHGACDKQEYEFRHIAAEHTHTVGCRVNGQLKGYLVYEMKQDSSFKHDLKIIDWFSNSNEAFQSLLTFLHQQKDQVSSIVFPTFDDDLAFMFNDPRHESKQLIHRIYHGTHERGTGLMYRIVNVPLFMMYIADHSFGQQTVAINFKVTDSLLNEESAHSIQFQNGKPQMSDEHLGHGISLSLDIADLSSLLMGCISLQKLLDYNKADADGNHDEIAKAIELFGKPTKPVSWTFF